MTIREVPEVNVLWAEFRLNGLAPVRDRLILHYSPLVKYVAGRVAVGLPHSVDQADLVSYGIIGLIDALEKFDPDRGFKFETYAITRIKGAILDELRSIDWVPRSVRAKARSVERACVELGLTEDQLQSIVGQISLVGVAALDETMSSGSGDRGEGATLGDTIADAHDGPSQLFELEEMRHLLASAIDRMPEREKIVLTLYYYEGLTLADIGEVLGVTESRVCQIHTKAVLHLRARLAAGDRVPGDQPVIRH